MVDSIIKTNEPATMSPPVQPQLFHEKVLHFLKEFPAWVVLLFVGIWLLFMIGRTETKADDAMGVEYVRFLQRLADGAFAALLLALNVRKTTNETNINNPGTIQTPAIHNQSMPTETVHTDSIDNSITEKKAAPKRKPKDFEG